LYLLILEFFNYYKLTLFIYIQKYFLVDEIKKKWKNIRDNFARDIKQKNSTPSGSGANPTKKYAYADVLSFLHPVLKKRK